DVIQPNPHFKAVRGTFVLDPSKTPKQIKITRYARENFAVMQGIYSLDGDTLRICMSDPKHGPIMEFGGKIGLDITLRREATAVGPSESADESITANPRLRKTIENPDRINGGYVRALGYTPDGSSLIAANHNLTVFDPATGKSQFQEELKSAVDTPLSFSK